MFDDHALIVSITAAESGESINSTSASTLFPVDKRRSSEKAGSIFCIARSRHIHRIGFSRPAPFIESS